MKKPLRSILAIIFIVVLFGLLACKQTETIKIGFAGTLSGVNSDLGVSGRNGAMLAVSDINDDGGVDGKKIELVSKDDKNDKDIALQVDQELYDEGVVAIIGHMTSSMAELTVPYVNQNKILMISPTIAVDSLSSIDDYFLHMIPSTKEQASAIAKAMAIEKVKKAAIVYDTANLSFSSRLKDQFIQDYSDLCCEIVFEEGFTPKGSDLAKLSAEIKQSGAEGVFIIAASDNVAMISQHLYKQGTGIKLFLPSWAMTTDLLDHGGKAIEGASLVNFYDISSQNEDYRVFKTKYIEEFGIDPSFAAQFSYEAVMVLAETMNHGTDLTAETLKKNMLSQKNFEGLQGLLQFDEYGDMARDSHIYKVVNGQFVITKNGEAK